MPSELDENTLEKYLRVKALADRGVAGEKSTAQQTLKKMEEKYPGIRTKALLHAARKKMAEREAERQSQQAPEEESSSHQPRQERKKPAGPTPAGGGGGGFQDIFNYARFFYEAADSFVKTASEVQVGSRLAEQIQVGSGTDRSGQIFTSFVFPKMVYNKFRELNPMQRKAFREKLHEFLDHQLDSYLGKES